MVGERIRVIRLQRGLTQKELGRRLGLSEPTVSNHETAATQIDADFLSRYADELHCSPCDFFDAPPGRAEPTVPRAFQDIPGLTSAPVGEQMFRRFREIQEREGRPDLSEQIRDLELDADEEAMLLMLGTFLKSRRGRGA